MKADNFHLYNYFIFSKVILRLFLALALVSIAGCLVDEDDTVEIKYRSTDTLRTLTGGEFFDYVVYGQTTSPTGITQSFEGTLNVTYLATTLQPPLNIGGPLIPVIQENTTLRLGASVFTLTRYLQQDVNGSISVLASSTTGIGGTIYRTGEDGNLSNPHPITIRTSPVPSTGGLANVDYQYMQGCESPATSCSAVVQDINDITIVYQGDADITTFDGRFQALRIDYNGLFLGPVSPVTPALFDLRGACDNDNATFFGSTYVFPEVGIVFIDNSCTSASGGGHRYTASLVNTNVAIP